MSTLIYFFVCAAWGALAVTLGHPSLKDGQIVWHNVGVVAVGSLVISTLYYYLANVINMNNLKTLNEAPEQVVTAQPRAAKRFIMVDLYTHKSTPIPSEEVAEAVKGLKTVEGALTLHIGEEYMVIELK
jgi:hypothetical protein